MNRLVRTIILGAALIGVALYAMSYHDEKVVSLELAGGHQKLRAAFVERAGYVRSLQMDDRYRDELSSLLKWYEAELTDLHNKYPGRFQADAALREIEAQLAAKKLKAEEAATKKEWYEHTKGFYEMLAQGRYAPIATAHVNGVRVDLLNPQRTHYEGRSRLRVDLVVWGAPRREMVSKLERGTVSKMGLDFAIKGLDLEFVDEKLKLVGGGETGAPTMLVDYPERWIPAFPPQVALGTWWIDPIPAESKTVAIKIDAEIRSPSAGSLPLQYSWNLPASDEWKVRAGEKFEGEERTMPEEDLDRSAAQ